MVNVWSKEDIVQALIIGSMVVVTLMTVASARAASSIELRVVSESDTALVLGWEPVAGAWGYRFSVDGQIVSRTKDEARSSVRFSKGHDTYGVHAITPDPDGPSGTYSPAPPPPPPPPPPPAGTDLAFLNTYWRCTQPLASYGPLPIRVRMDFTEGVNFVPPNGAGVVQIGSGCTGDGTPATDLILDVRGNGLSYGSGDDAIRVMNGATAHDIEIEGHADCGARQGAAHQDGIQVLGGTNITFRDFSVGDYDAGLSTCQGAGGAFFYSLPSVNTRVVGGKYIACNHSLLAGTPAGSVEGASFRSGRNDGSDLVCHYASSPPCIFSSAEVVRGPGVVCQQWIAGAWVDR